MTQNGRICSKCKIYKPRKEFNECFYKDRESTITPRCRDCRSNAYYSKRYDTKCIQCLKPKKLDKNQICGKCNEENGLRQCKECNELLLINLSFYGHKQKCIQCYKKN